MDKQQMPVLGACPLDDAQNQQVYFIINWYYRNPDLHDSSTLVFTHQFFFIFFFNIHFGIL